MVRRQKGIHKASASRLKDQGIHQKRYYAAGVSKVIIERAAEKIRIRILVARPGIIIGRKGAEVEQLKKDLLAIAPVITTA